MGQMQQDADEYFRVWNPEQADPNHQEKPEELEVCTDYVLFHCVPFQKPC